MGRIIGRFNPEFIKPQKYNPVLLHTLLERSGVPRRYWDCDGGQYDKGSMEFRHLSTYFKQENLKKHLTEGLNIFITEGSHEKRTRLGICFLRAAIKCGLTCYYTRTDRLVHEYEKKTQWPDMDVLLFDALQEVHVLMLAEIEQCLHSYRADLIRMLIRTRQDNALPTIYTVSEEERAADLYGESFVESLTHESLVIRV